MRQRAAVAGSARPARRSDVRLRAAPGGVSVERSYAGGRPQIVIGIAKRTLGRARWRHAAAAALALGVAVWLPGGATAAFPGANGLIAFTSNREGNDEIYVMNADGTGQIKRTDTAGGDQQPAW